MVAIYLIMYMYKGRRTGCLYGKSVKARLQEAVPAVYAYWEILCMLCVPWQSAFFLGCHVCIELNKAICQEDV
jgi:hypothetical protein